MKLLVAGDFCPQNRVAESIEKNDYFSCLDEFRQIINKVDYSIVNLECPITKGGERAIQKFGPNLQCSSKAVDVIKWIGFNCVTLANNHFLDYDEAGVCNTLKELSLHNVDHVGGGLNLRNASKVLYKNVDGKTLAIINCCEHEFSIADENEAGSNPLNPIQQFYAIRQARMKADYVILIVHGGHEHYQLPSPRMQEVYRFFVDAGADVVINHHQHCYSGYELYKERPIIYGLGNFWFDELSHDKLWEEGYCVIVDFDNNLELSIVPYIQCRESAKISVMGKEDRIGFFSKLNELNTIIMNKAMLKQCFDDFSKSMQNVILSSFEPYSGKLLNYLYAHGLLPSFLEKSRMTKALNFINCESYHDLLVNTLQNMK